jgi:P27 family predicted phage terminase small subunit
MKGRKPLPSKVIDIKGARGYHRTKTDVETEPSPPSSIPECPEHLSPEAKIEWCRMAVNMEPLGILTNLDKAIFAMYCEAYANWAMATIRVQTEGMVSITDKGYPIQNPYFSIANKAKEQMLKAMVEMGMTPSSRSRIKVEKPAETENVKERFFK